MVRVLLRVLLVAAVVAVLLAGGEDRRGAAGRSRVSGADVDSGAACESRARAVRVRLSRERWPHVADHVADVDQDFPRRLHIDREGAEENREDSLRGVPTREGFDRDEYPPAVSREGGAGADVRYVESGENRSAGAAMGARLEPWCDGQAFRLVVRR